LVAERNSTKYVRGSFVRAKDIRHPVIRNSNQDIRISNQYAKIQNSDSDSNPDIRGSGYPISVHVWPSLIGTWFQFVLR